ncbi:hypothetical protein [Streptomyces inhibens]|uniref:hypothetical protein n=1 Tax=Streptomyces inhibens TaxID=2293571 RepID=UPI001EE6EC37|nr:hypothetical protein [Streptomyces inhibens]UKY51347.1 hypothetical protein KI385_22735 [Streptomyces inhibens]
MRVTITDGAFDTPGTPNNCYYAKHHRTIFCEFPNAVPVGAGYETAKPLPEVFGHSLVRGAYTYSVWPLGDPPAHTEDYKAQYERGREPALGLEPVAVGTLKGGGELRFVSAGYADRADWGIKGITLRGRIGEYAVAAIPAPTGLAQRVRVEVPQGTTFAPLTREEREGLPSESDYCSRDQEDGNIYCSNANWFVTLRVRIDRRVEGAEGRISVPEPANGDTNPSNNTAPIKLEITGPARADQWVPPVPTDRDDPVNPDVSPLSSAIDIDSRTRDIALAAAASAAALALVTFLLMRRGRTRRAAASRQPGAEE